MENLAIALGPAFAAGFAVQRLIEILDPIFEKFKIIKKYKAAFLGLASLIVGLFLAFSAGLRVLKHLGVSNVDFIDGLVTALIVSAGTEGFNSIMKFLGYSKDKKKKELLK